MSAESKTNLFGLDREALREFFAAIDEKPYRAEQLLKWIYQAGELDFERMTNLSKPLRARLRSIAEVTPPECFREQTSTDGTRKWLVRLTDGNCVETVFIPETDRGTLCVSSQVGCALNCSFCSTARQGYNRNLTGAEIIGQVWVANRVLGAERPGTRPVTNVVLMGMGEPLLNFDNVVRAMHLMLDDFAFGLSRRRVTLSTAGVVPAIDRLARDCPVSLAVSLHAPDDPLRDRLVPLNKKYPLDLLLAACRRYVRNQPRRRVTFEYVMLDGVNDSVEHARRLVQRLHGVPAKVNLIPFNPFPGAELRRSPAPVIERFRDVLSAAGVVTVTRKTRGEDIDAACGQLAGRVRDRTRRSQLYRQRLAS